MITIGVVQFPGSNCERETILAIKRCGMAAKELLWNMPKSEFEACDGFIIVGGFSYEDRSRSGIVAALDPVLAILKEQDQKRKPILGICNGAQVLVESGLVPGFQDYKVGVALTHNRRIKDGKILGTGFYNDWVCLTAPPTSRPNAFSQALERDQVLKMPAAHAEGRFVMPKKVLAALKESGQVAFKYCDADGHCENEFPVNPNGSMENIAAIINADGNVMAMMPHPERTEKCDALLLSMKKYIEMCDKPKGHSFHCKLPKFEVKNYEESSRQFFVKLMITDNHAATVENALRHLGVPVTVRREIHWAIDCDDSEIKKIEASGELFNTNKEAVSEAAQFKSGASFLVRDVENTLGLEKQQMLNRHFGVESIQSIKHGIVWHLTFDDGDQQTWLEKIKSLNVLFNPFAHEVFSL